MLNPTQMLLWIDLRWFDSLASTATTKCFFHVFHIALCPVFLFCLCSLLFLCCSFTSTFFIICFLLVLSALNLSPYAADLSNFFSVLHCFNLFFFVFPLSPPLLQDGSCNGLQHYAALGRDVIGAKSVNLMPCEVPQDVYSGVAQQVSRFLVCSVLFPSLNLK